MSTTDSTLDTKDYWCRNCKFRFVPTYWIGGGYNYVTPQCPNCGSNATEEYINQQIVKDDADFERLEEAELQDLRDSEEN